MPYCFGEGDPGWDEFMDGEDRSPKAAQFRYLPPPDLGGSPEPVHFSDQIPGPRSSSPPQPAPPPSLLDRLLGRGPRRPTWQERQREQERRDQHWLALVAQALREIGARRLYGRYDGGNDDGFAWLVHVEMASGERLAPDEAARRLRDAVARAPGRDRALARPVGGG